MKQGITIVVLLLLATTGMAQYSLSGEVVAEDGWYLPEAYVLLSKEGKPLEMASTDADGFFVFTGLEPGGYELSFSYLGYESVSKRVELKKSAFLEIILKTSVYNVPLIEVKSTWAQPDMPIPVNTIDEEEIRQNNYGQDLPYLLRRLPGVVVSSDAGNGVGYTSIRVRGSDPGRTNVTINGIPLNDAESQLVFWVDLPDLLSSTSNLQVQRGIGTSTNGTGAFGATIHLQTDQIPSEKFSRISNSFGSYNTRKHTFQAGTGLLKNHWGFKAQLSAIRSDGYIDRASSNLNSYHLTGGFTSAKTVVKALIFSGNERTYQSWYGTPQSRLEDDIDAMETHAINNGLSVAQTANLLQSDRTYNFYTYEDQVDDYNQDHFQLLGSHLFASNLIGEVVMHYTKGKGFFEEYRESDALSAYGLDPGTIGDSTILNSEIVRRRFLDNDFYGFTYALKYTNDRSWELQLAGGWHQYKGDHFGKIIWASQPLNVQKDFEYYRGIGEKDDFNSALKINIPLSSKWSVYGDMQLRSVKYTAMGRDNNLVDYDVDESYLFFNPKVGFRLNVNDKQSIFGYLGVGNREPNRNDFIDQIGKFPESERLTDLELGYSYSSDHVHLSANTYLMHYKDQLVLTGELNDVGQPIRTNVNKSYRAGLEIQGQWTISNKLSWYSNVAVSRNKIKNFTEYLYDYTDGIEIIQNDFTNTDISFSPSITGSSILKMGLFNGMDISLESFYTGKQFLDNTSNSDKEIEAFFVNDLNLSYKLEGKRKTSIGVGFRINNLFSEKYSANGYTYSYKFGELITENFFYPQATRNYMISLELGF